MTENPDSLTDDIHGHMISGRRAADGGGWCWYCNAHHDKVETKRTPCCGDCWYDTPPDSENPESLVSRLRSMGFGTCDEAADLIEALLADDGGIELTMPKPKVIARYYLRPDRIEDDDHPGMADPLNPPGPQGR